VLFYRRQNILNLHICFILKGGTEPCNRTLCVDPGRVGEGKVTGNSGVIGQNKQWKGHKRDRIKKICRLQREGRITRDTN
jgi:hypothetical protein